MDKNELLLKLERSSRDRDFFILNKERILNSYIYLDDLLAKYIDICCMKFKTFSVNKTSYMYGSIVTLAVGFLVSKQKHFENARGDVLYYMVTSMYKLFMDEYYTENLITEQTQLHMLKGTISEYEPCLSEEYHYCEGQFDSHFNGDFPVILRKYLNQILTYCAEHKIAGYTEKDVFDEVYPLLKNIF